MAQTKGMGDAEEATVIGYTLFKGGCAPVFNNQRPQSDSTSVEHLAGTLFSLALSVAVSPKWILFVREILVHV